MGGRRMKALEEIPSQNRAIVLVIYGRRRIWQTELIENFCSVQVLPIWRDAPFLFT